MQMRDLLLPRNEMFEKARVFAAEVESTNLRIQRENADSLMGAAQFLLKGIEHPEDSIQRIDVFLAQGGSIEMIQGFDEAI